MSHGPLCKHQVIVAYNGTSESVAHHRPLCTGDFMRKIKWTGSRKQRRGSGQRAVNYSAPAPPPPPPRCPQNSRQRPKSHQNRFSSFQDNGLINMCNAVNINKMQLKGTLGERQRELNNKVNEAVSSNVDFDEVKVQYVADDLDKLFKIDVASKYKNFDYILEVLKCGDSLYVTRALKCTWLYNDEYINFINPDYLHKNVFPFMSTKMKERFCSRISMHVKDESRAESFYNYCEKEDMERIAFKFLIFTSEEFKQRLMNDETTLLWRLNENAKYLKMFMRNSQELIDIYLYEVSEIGPNFFYNLSFMYFVSSDDYLNLIDAKLNDKKNYKRLGLRVSKSIMKNHKERVVNNFYKYMRILNERVFYKFTAVDEAKQYITQLLPDKSSTFWENDFCKKYESILNLIPAEERFEFIKKIFNEKYSETPFEMATEFESLNYFKMLSVDDREAWALRRIETKKYFYSAADYDLYRFVKFEKAFVLLNKDIAKTEDLDENSLKGEIIAILVESTRSQRDLERLINHYCDVQDRVKIEKKRSFADKVIKHYNVYNFDEDCWTAFDKILQFINVYNVEIEDKSRHSAYGLIALIYYVVHKKNIPEVLQQYMDIIVDFSNLENELTKLNKEQQEIMYDYLIKFFVNKIRSYENQTYNNEIQVKVRNYINFVQKILEYFDKKLECPEIIAKYKKFDQDYFKPIEQQPLEESDLLRYLKRDASLVVNAIPALEHEIINKGKIMRLKQLLTKLKVYFPNDIAEEYLEFYKKLLSNPKINRNIASSAVYGIFQLADENTKCEFLAKYVPSDTNVVFKNIDTNLLYIQEAICRFACYSRPPVPLSKIFPYITGAYLKYCFPMIAFYTTNLPLPQFVEFVVSLLKGDESLQKRGLLLIFNCYCFTVADVNEQVQKAWAKTRNPSFRKFIYTNFYEYFIYSDDDAQTNMFEVLKLLISDLNDDDDEDILQLVVDCKEIPLKFKGKYLKTVWATVSQLSENNNNMVSILDQMMEHSNLIDKDCINKIVNKYILQDKVILAKNPIRAGVWKLLAIHFTKVEETPKWILNLLKLIVKKFVELWNSDNAPKAYNEFIQTFVDKHFQYRHGVRIHNSMLFETILAELQKSLPQEEIYMIVWNIQLYIIATKAAFEDGLKNIAACFGRELTKLVRENVISKKYYKSFYRYRVDAINNVFSLIIEGTSLHPHDINRFKGLVGMNLVESGMLETRLLGIEMISISNCCTCENGYYDIVKIIKEFENDEVQCLLFQKFFENGFSKEMAKVMFD